MTMWKSAPVWFPEKTVEDSFVLGVSGGLAKHYGVSPTLLRLTFVLATFLFLVGLFVYVVLAYAMPWPPLTPRTARIAFIVASVPTVILSLLSTLAYLLNVEQFWVYYLWGIGVLTWVLVGFTLALLFVISRLEMFTGVVSALGLGMVCLGATGVLNLLLWAVF